MEERRWVTLGIACGVHLAALGGLAALKARAPAEPRQTEANELEIAVDDEPELAPPAPTPPAAVDARGAGRAPAKTGAASAKAKSAAPAPGVEEVLVAPPATPEAASPDEHGGWSFSPVATEARIDPRAAVTPDLVAGAERNPGAPVGASTSGGVAEGLAAHDVELGLGRGGVILAAAETAARSADAPLSGDATFDVVVRGDGTVDARLASATGDAAAWSRLAASLGHAIDVRRMRLPPGSRGWRVAVRVEASVHLPDGRDVRELHGARASLEPSALQNAAEGKPGARGSSAGPGGPDHVGGGPSEPPPQGGALGRGPSNAGAAVITGVAQRVLPTPTISVEGKACSAKLAITPLGVGIAGWCHLENIGNGTMRVVHGRIVSEGPL